MVRARRGILKGPFILAHIVFCYKYAQAYGNYNRIQYVQGLYLYAHISELIVNQLGVT